MNHERQSVHWGHQPVAALHDLIDIFVWIFISENLSVSEKVGLDLSNVFWEWWNRLEGQC